jgi:uncharacterized protein
MHENQCCRKGSKFLSIGVERIVGCSPCFRVLLICFNFKRNLRLLMKILFLIVLAIVALLLLRKVQAFRKRVQPPPASSASERMVKCAHCGVNQPISESVLTHGRYYCCSAHWHEAESGQD